MSWVIRGYDKTDAVVSETSVDDLLREWFRQQLEIRADDPMLDSYPLPRTLALSFLSAYGADARPEVDYYLDYDAPPGAGTE